MLRFLIAFAAFCAISLTSYAQPNRIGGNGCTNNCTFTGNTNTSGLTDSVSIAAPVVTGSGGSAARSATTAYATGAVGNMLPITYPSAIQVGQVASGTNIPASTQVLMVSGGTSSVSLTAPIAVASGAYFLPFSDTTGLSALQAIRDTTTTAAIPNNTFITRITSSSASPVTVTGTAGAAGQNVITVSSGGTGCAAGMLLFDSTSSVVPTDSLVVSSTATTVTIDHNITAGGIGASDAIKCYPAVQMNFALASGVVLSDTIVATPVVYLSRPTTGSIPGGTTVNFSALTGSIASGVSSGGPISMSLGGITLNGTTVFSVGNGYASGGNYNFSNLTAGYGAAANMTPNDTFGVYMGYNAANKLRVQGGSNGTQSTVVGGNSLASSVDSTSVTAFGHSVLANCAGGQVPGSAVSPPLTNCSNIIALGVDTLSNSTGATDSIWLGVRNSGTYENGFNNIVAGSAVMQGTAGAPSTDYRNTIICFSCVSGNDGNMNGIHDNIVMAHGGMKFPTTASQNVVIGPLSGAAATGAAMTTDNRDTIVGPGAGNKLAGSQLVTALGNLACSNATSASNVTCIGASTGNANLTTGFNVLLIGSGKGSVTTPGANTSNFVNIENVIMGNTNTPVIFSGFGTSASVVRGTQFAFEVNVGTGGTASVGVIGFSTTLPNTLMCNAINYTSNATMDTRATATAGSAGFRLTLTNYARSAPTTPAAWNASDILHVTCTGD